MKKKIALVMACAMTVASLAGCGGGSGSTSTTAAAAGGETTAAAAGGETTAAAEAPAGGGEDRMQDPDSRYLKTKTGQELALAPGHMRLSCGKGKSAVTIHNSGKISIQTVGAVEAEAEEELTVHAEEELLLHAKEGIVLQSLSGGLAKLEGDKAIFRGTEVKLE